MTGLLDRVVLPIASEEDAVATARALGGHEVGSLLAVHVIEKAGGAPDKAGVEQREDAAEEAFTTLKAHLGGDYDLETEVRYGTDVADAVFEAAADYDATAIVITPRGGSRWIQLLTGDVALSLVTETDRPVVVLPDVEDAADEAVDDQPDEAVDTDDAADDRDGAGGTDGE